MYFLEYMNLTGKRNFLIATILFLVIHFSCKMKDPMIEMFSAFISNSTKVNIAYGNRLDTSQIIIDTTISRMSEVEKIKNFIVQSGERDTCYHLS